jgi:cold shock CspA family protein
VQGKVKWFSEEKGYGFVTDATSTDRFFSVRDIIGSELPPTGSVVEFEPAEGKRGPRAQAVRIVTKPLATRINTYTFSSPKERDDRAICGSCGKKMVPRLIIHRGVIQRSVCPFCGATYKAFGFPWHWVILIGGVWWLLYSAIHWVQGLFD